MLLPQVYTSVSVPHVRAWSLVPLLWNSLAAGEDMVILKHTAVVLILACIVQQVLVAEGGRGEGRKGRRDGKAEESGGEEGPPQSQPAAVKDSSVNEKTSLKGKFTTKDKTKCTWLADEGDTVTLAVVCEKGGVGFNCEYTARPAACAPYALNPKAYWKQIARSLKKQRNICEDATALVRAGMCKKAPKVAHFKLLISTPAPPPPETPGGSSSENESCSHQNKLAEEYCSGSWVNLCNFFFTMVQTDDC
ncbi:hypothetical protein GJAV_G00068100 [Gymnothorax javanicus]|nr:hypothetical protein GJAV_G00068100 [Gymnothorax javanicus]